MILCCGEALMDLIPETATGPAQALVGGSVLNTAVALGRLGASVGLMTGLSSDEYGQQIEAHLRDSKVDTSFCMRSDRPTTLAVVTFNDGQPSYEFRDEGSALRMLRPQDLPAIPDQVSAMVFGGISLIPAPVADTLAHACVERPASTVVLLDANVRPGFIDDPDTYRARLALMLATANIVKVSDEDLEWLLPDSRDPIADLLAQGPQMVLVTRGPDGSEAYRASGLVARAGAQKVEVEDTVGAGDTFNAGFLKTLADLGLLTKDGLESADETALVQALSYGGKAAAITVSRAGANPPWAHEIA